MKICDACNKKTLLPETLGEAIICKPCFIKINGPVWKYILKAKNGTDLEKNRSKATEAAQKFNYPDKVIKGINQFFDDEKNKMLKCDVCNELVSQQNQIDKYCLCNKCYKQINISEWKKTEFFNRKAFAEGREKVISKAEAANFPEALIDTIKKIYNQKVEEDWLYTLESVEGQKIKVYEDYVIIETNDNFPASQIKENLKETIVEAPERTGMDVFKEEALNDLKHLKNPLKLTNLARNSISAVNNRASAKIREVPFALKVAKGIKKLPFSEYSIVDMINPKDNSIYNYLEFSSSSTGNEYQYFFEDSDISKVEEILSVIEKKILASSNKTKKTDYKGETDNYSKLRELKALLDDGIITQEDFDRKKKELLDLK